MTERSISLFDLDALAPLAELGVRFGVEFEIFGSVASRAAMAFLRGRSDLILLDLVPNTSDVDVVHSGPSYLDRPLLAAINENVPYAQWVRWSVRSIQEKTPPWAARGLAGGVPLREVAIGTRPRAIPRAFLEAMDADRPRFFASPDFTSLAAFQAGHEFELFSVLIYLASLTDLAGWRGDVAPDFDALRRVAERHRAVEAPTFERQELRLRLWYLLSSWIGSTNWSSARGLLADLHLLESLPQDVWTPFEKEDAVVTSSPLPSGSYRLQRGTSLERRQWAEIVIKSGLARRRGEPGVLDPVFTPLATTSNMVVARDPERRQTLEEGERFDPSRFDGEEWERPEFVTLSWETHGDDPPPDALTAFLFLNAAGSDETQTITTNVVAGRQGRHARTWLRLDLGPALRMTRSANDQVMVAVVQASKSGGWQEGG